ncbi:MupG family TIM beta-alpha barrel fold protein [Curtobacterium flaccumfaciens]|nr:MupG family TIM beta-alpha barrel fold protein [Curtobacterium flaccumfaciens]
MSAGLSVVADVSPKTARLLGDSPWEFLRSIGVARVRIDFGFSVAEIRSIAAVLPIALNASTLRAADLAPFADLDVELIHNFYPREWTGLALSSVVESVSVARRFGWRVGAFIAGDSVRRGPLGEGLPTVEEHRNMPPLFQALSLVDAGVDDVYVGDPALTEHSWSRLGSFVREDLVVLDGTAAPGVHPAVIEALAIPDRNRPDAAEAMIRLEHSRGAVRRAAAARGRWAAEADGLGHRAVGVGGEVLRGACDHVTGSAGRRPRRRARKSPNAPLDYPYRCNQHGPCLRPVDSQNPPDPQKTAVAEPCDTPMEQPNLQQSPLLYRSRSAA